MTQRPLHLEGGLKLTLGQASSAGVKAVNEDSIGIRVPAEPLLTAKGAVAAIADGVSSAEAGKEASDTCVTAFLSDYFSTPESWSVKKSAQQVLNALNRWLYGQGQRFISAEKGYVCTLSIVVFKSHTAHIFHVGDSRVYRLRGAELEQLTRDHATRINSEQAYLTRAMGLDVWLEVDYRAVELKQGDIYFLSTDGIHDVLSPPQLRDALLNGSDDYESLAISLIDAARAQQSRDNLSCQIIRVDGLPLASADDVYRSLSALPFPPYLEPGMVLDGYRVEAEIHASSRSQLYRVVDVDSGERFVMKTPSVNYEDDAAYIERFVMESWIGRRIDSPHIMRVLPEDRDKSCLYYIAEYVDGESLRDWMKRHPRPPVQQVVEIAEQVVKGLRALHNRETYHQDLKPENIMIDGDGRVIIVDFGSCHVAGIAEIYVPLQRDKVLGTAQYSSPEHKSGRRPGAESDQFSLAVILFEMLAGKLPYQQKLEYAKTPADYSRLSYEPVYVHNPLVPEWFDAALRKALSIRPEQRYRDVSEFLHDLKHPNPRFADDSKLPFVERNPVRFWQVVSALLLLAELATLVYFLR